MCGQCKIQNLFFCFSYKRKKLFKKFYRKYRQWYFIKKKFKWCIIYQRHLSIKFIVFVYFCSFRITWTVQWIVLWIILDFLLNDWQPENFFDLLILIFTSKFFFNLIFYLSIFILQKYFRTVICCCCCIKVHSLITLLPVMCRQFFMFFIW